MRNIIKNKKVFVITILFLALFVTYGAPMLEAGSCEKAFKLCMNTFISSIYGMNFINMPELNWTFSYFTIMGVMGLLVLVELWWFKRKGWFD